MRSFFSRASRCAGAIVIIVAVAWAQGLSIPIRYQYHYRQNPSREEGISPGEAAGGERLELVSAVVHSTQKSSPAADRLFVGFSADITQNVVVAVRDPANNYWMKPVDESRKPFFRAQAGFNTFSWDATDAKYIRRTAGDLLALVQLSTTKTAIFPAILWDSSATLPSNLRVDEYEFAFLPNAKGDFKYEIGTKQGKQLKTDDLIDLPKGVVFKVFWNAEAQPDDSYEFKGTATFTLASNKKVNQQLQFSFLRKTSIK
jgi:hypothetical protein